MPDADRLARAVLQHAESSRLLGVPFVPVYRSATAPASQPEPAPPEVVVVPVTARAAMPAPAPLLAPEEPFGSSGAIPDMPTGLDIRPASRDPNDVQAALDQLRRRYEADAPHQHFVTDHHSIVFGEGAPCAPLMFVGEAPGAEE